MDTSDASNYALEETRDKVLYLVHLTYFEDFLQLGQEKCLLHTVGEGPISKKSFKECDGECAILSQEQHGATEKLLVELRASLNFVKGNNDVLEEYDVLVTKGHGEAAYNTCENI